MFCCARQGMLVIKKIYSVNIQIFFCLLTSLCVTQYKILQMNTSTLIWGVIFGSIGLGFFVYGKKQKSVIPLLSGIGLMIFPYFISNIYILIPFRYSFDRITLFY